MILCDHHIEKAIRDGLLIIQPVPGPHQYDSSALNLRVGDDFRIWKRALKAKGTTHTINLDDIRPYAN
jgi:deoxycytidine triphosphate deaminase